MARYTIKRPEKHILIFLIFLCVFLLILILYVQGEMAGLQKFFMRNVQSDNADKQEVVEDVPMPYTCDLRIALTDVDGDIYRTGAQIYGNQGMTVVVDGAQSVVGPNEKYTYPGSGAVQITPAEGGQLYIVGNARNYGYEGGFEIISVSSGIVIVNQIPMEQYLKRVVPSEMPYTYGQEALKAQAICARTYAYGRSNAYAYPEVSAHMDDTVSFQVYNNCEETAETNQAIADTTGQILMRGDTVLEALYYSTSCGYGQDGSIFGEKMDLSVFPSVYIGFEEHKEDFDSYIRKADESAYERGERYFRWTARTDADCLQSLRSAILSVQKEDGAVECNKKMQGRLADTKKDASLTLKGLEEMKVIERNPGGAVTKLEIRFATGKVKINGQLHIRQVLGSICNSVTLQNGEVLSDVTSLPSAAVSIEKQADGTYLFYGGGFGHGVGMSQNGAKALCAVGYSYKDILGFFYKNTQLTTIQ